MASTSLQVAGIASGFDWKSFVDQIMALERAPADRLEAEQDLNNQKSTQLTTLGTRLTALQTAANALKSSTLFGQRVAKMGASSTWTTTAGTNTAVGTYKISVTQLAAAAQIRGSADIGAALNPAGNDVSALTIANLPLGQAVSAGTFTVNGQKVNVALTDSLQDVFNAIASATQGQVTASYDSSTDKVSLTSASGEVMLGAANDTSNFLRALKLGNNGTTTVTSSARLGTVRTAATLATANLGQSLTAAPDGSGSFSLNGVQITYNINTDTLSSVIKRINDSTAGVKAAYDATNDQISLVNQSTGDLGISVAGDTGGLLNALGLASGTTFSRGLNAEFSINDGATLSSASNTLDSTSHGIAGLSVTVDSESTQSIAVSTDTAAMKSKIESFIESFNAVQQFLETSTKITTDAKGKVTAATLAGNREIQEWGRSLRTMAFAAVSGLTGTIKQLNDLGIDFKTGTSELEIEDSSKLDKALANSTSQVEAFFTTASTGLAAKFDGFLERITKQNKAQQERLRAANASLEEQIKAIERRLEQQRAVLESAFIQMENAQSQIKQQQTALSGMLAQQAQK
jgi:flagellar hook-associated protein 2